MNQSPQTADAAKWDLLTECVGYPARVVLFHPQHGDRIGRVFGDVESVTVRRELTITCLTLVNAVQPGTRAVVEILVRGQLHFLFSSIQWVAQPDNKLYLTSPSEVRTKQLRSVPRIEVSIPVHYVTEEMSTPQRGVIDNLSAGGLAFWAPTGVQPGELLRLAFGIGSGHYFQEVRARVLRSTQLARGGALVAVQFIGLEEEARSHLVQWVINQRGRSDELENYTEHI